jgi:hypothetical protein
MGGGETGTTSLQHFGRLTPTGCSTSFDPGANSSVHSLAVQLDRKIVVVGAFTTLGGGGTGTAPRRVRYSSSVSTPPYTVSTRSPFAVTGTITRCAPEVLERSEARFKAIVESGP